jgi:hypothetical protein
LWFKDKEQFLIQSFKRSYPNDDSAKQKIYDELLKSFKPKPPSLSSKLSEMIKQNSANKPQSRSKNPPSVLKEAQWESPKKIIKTKFAQNVMFRKQLREMKSDPSKLISVSNFQKERRESKPSNTQGNFIVHELENNQRHLVVSSSYESLVDAKFPEFLTSDNREEFFGQLPKIEKRPKELTISTGSKSSMNQKKIAKINFQENSNLPKEYLVERLKEKNNKTPMSTDFKTKIPAIDVLNFAKIGQNMSKYFKELSDKRSTNMSDARGQRGDFISNADVSAKYYTNSTSMGSQLPREQK